MKQIFYIIILLCSNFPAVAQNSTTFLKKVVSVCESGSREASDLAMLREGAEKFNLPELAGLADIRENRSIDVQNRYSVEAA